MFIVLAYIKFLLRSTNQHGVHSPFVYDLVTKCFYDKKKYPAYEILKDYRKSLLKDKRIIKVTDFGAGSRRFKSDERKVLEIAKNAGISPKRARLLNRLVRYLKVDNSLELGTSVGLGTVAIAAGNKVQVSSIEGCPATAKIAGERLRDFGLTNAELKIGKFEEFIEDSGQRTVSGEPSKSKLLTPNSKASSAQNRELTTLSYDLIYIDGNHQKEATLRYFEKLLPRVHNDCVVLFDDIHWSRQMEEAWEEIKQHPRVTVSIDTFQWGLVFFRREQGKEHFVIRV